MTRQAAGTRINLLLNPPTGKGVQVLDEIGRFPVIIRPAFTLGGTGGGIAYNMDEFKDIMDQGLTASVTNQASRLAACQPWSCTRLDPKP